MALTELQTKLGGINVNGRVHYFDRVHNLTRAGRGRWSVKRYDVMYYIEGGRHAGGTRKEWFLYGGDLNGDIKCTSLVDALKLLEGM